MSLSRLQWFVSLLALAVISSPAFADRSQDRTQVGHNITIGPDEDATEATCFGCSIRVRGHVAGDVTTFGGSIVVEENGKVDGDATAFAGDLRLDRQVEVKGDVTVFGGKLRRDQDASVGGDVTNLSGAGWLVLVFVAPFVIFAGLVVGLVWLILRLFRPRVAATA